MEISSTKAFKVFLNLLAIFLENVINVYSLSIDTYQCQLFYIKEDFVLVASTYLSNTHKIIIQEFCNKTTLAPPRGCIFICICYISSVVFYLYMIYLSIFLIPSISNKKLRFFNICTLATSSD